MASSARNESNKKQVNEAQIKPKARRCLMCSSEFQSLHYGERICKSCKETAAWREGGWAA